MSRLYRAPWDCNSSVSQAIEACVLDNNSSKTMIRITRVTVTCVSASLPAAQMVPTQMWILSGTIGGGGGGSSVTPQKNDVGDPASIAIAQKGNTTLHTGTVPYEVAEKGIYVYQGLDYIPTEPIPIAPGEFFQLLLGITSSVLAMEGVVEYEEIGG